MTCTLFFMSFRNPSFPLLLFLPFLFYVRSVLFNIYSYIYFCVCILQDLNFPLEHIFPFTTSPQRAILPLFSHLSPSKSCLFKSNTLSPIHFSVPSLLNIIRSTKILRVNSLFLRVVLVLFST